MTNEKSKFGKDRAYQAKVLSVSPPTPVLADIPSSSPAMNESALFLSRYLKNNHSIVLFGDFDVDGTSSAACMYLFAKLAGVEVVTPFVSKRTDGYGLSKAAIHRLKTENPSPKDTLIILMDLGVSTVSEAESLLKHGFDVLVIDHLVPRPGAKEDWEKLRSNFPNQVHVYDPLLCDGEDDRYFSCLSAAGLVHALIWNILNNNLSGVGENVLSNDKVQINVGQKPQHLQTVINTINKIAAIAQAADCMPFSKDGKLTAAWKVAKEYETGGDLLAGVSCLYEISSTASRVSWVVAPILNAAGRLDDAYAAFELLVETDLESAKSRIESLQKVRTDVRGQTKLASVSLDNDIMTSSGVAVLINQEGKVVSGVVGIAAAKASEAFIAPALYMAVEFNKDYNTQVLKGSMRRGETNFSCEEWVLKLRLSGIAIAGGGHPAAAGVTVPLDKAEELIESAMTATYDIETPPVYKVSPTKAAEYQENVTKTLPFGRGHDSAIMLIEGNLASIRSFTTSKSGTPEVWMYSLTITDPSNGKSVDVKVIKNDLDEATLNEIASMSDKGLINKPIEVKAVVHDGFKFGSKYKRTEIRAAATKSERRLINTPEGERNEVVKTADIKIANKKESKDSASLMTDTIDSYTTQTLDENSLGKYASLSRPDLARDVDGTPIVSVAIDWEESGHARVFTLRKPYQNVVESTIGEKSAKALQSYHGGVWDKSKRAYHIPAAAAKVIAEDELVRRGLAPKNNDNEEGSGKKKKVDFSVNWRFDFSINALKQLANLDIESDAIANQKVDTRPFKIPALRNGINAYGFQFADVRLFIQRPVALNNNDMGTGKTFEASVWGSLRYHGAVYDHVSKEIRCLPNKGNTNKPVLVVTLKNVAGQFAREINRFLELKVGNFSSPDVRHFLKKQNLANDVEDDSEDDVDEISDKRVFKPLAVVDQSVSDNFRKEYIDGSAFIVTTYDCLARHPWIVSSFDWSGVICDEAHELKNPDAHKTKALFGKTCDGSPLRGAPVLALSGTFAKNRPKDWFVWVRLTGADGGVYSSGSLSSGLRDFCIRYDGLKFKEFFRGGRRMIIPESGTPENGRELNIMLVPFRVRRLKTEIGEIPSISVVQHRIPSRGLYTDVLSSLVKSKGDDIVSNLSSKSLELLKKHKLVGKNGDVGSEKVATDSESETKEVNKEVKPDSLAGKLAMIASLDKACGIIDVMSDKGWMNSNGKLNEPVVIIAAHRAGMNEICNRLEGAGIEHFAMAHSDSLESRDLKKEAFQRGERMVFVTTYGVGGVGLNLTRARKAILAGLPYTETLLAQARDRIHRIGQTRDVEVLVLIQSASIDEAVWQIISQKGRANFATMSVDKLKSGALPSWATGSIVDQSRIARIESKKTEERKDKQSSIIDERLAIANSGAVQGFGKR